MFWLIIVKTEKPGSAKVHDIPLTPSAFIRRSRAMPLGPQRLSSRAILLSLSALSSLVPLFGQSAQAQSTTASTIPAQPPAVIAAHSQNTTKTAKPGHQSIDDVLVLGTRARPLQHDSLPATVFTQRDIQQAGITSPQDFMKLTPGVSMIEGNAPSNSQISIRGVSQTYSVSAEAPIGVIVDGVPLTSPADFNQSLYNLQTIEVVKGPQNAIYGRNAVGGAIVVNTLAPPTVWTSSVTAGATNGGGFNTVLKTGGPLIANLASVSLVASEDHFDGLYENIVTGKKVDFYNNQGLTGRLFVTPAPDLTIDLKAGYTSMYGGALAFRAQIPGNPYYTGRIPDVNNSSEPYAADLPNNSRTLKNNVSVRVNYETQVGSISSVSAYNFNKDNDIAALFPYIAVPLGTADGTQAEEYSNSAFFQELKFKSEGLGPLHYQFGADYYDFTRRNTTNTGVTYNQTIYGGSGPFQAGSDNPTLAYADDIFHTKAWELFGEATYDITSDLILDGAIRYSRNDITDRNKTQSAYTEFPDELRSEAYSKAEPRVTITYKLTNSTNIFADWALGSLPGGFNPTGSALAVRKIYPTAVVSDTYNQETSRNFEFGFNSQLFQRRLILSGSAYYNLMTNQQYDLYYPAASIEVLNTIDKIRIYGGELQADVMPLKGWHVSSTLGLTAAKIEGFAADPTAVGNRPPYTPDFTFNFAISREYRISEHLTGFARFDDSVKGTQYWEADNLPGARSNVVNLANIRVGVRGGDWSITAFVKNLADNRYNEDNVVLTGSAVATYLAPPRIYGAVATVGF